MNEQRVQEALEKHWPDRPLKCCVCGGRKWAANSNMYSIESFPKPNEAIPLIAMICNSCGNVLLFSAIVLGLLDKQGNETEAPDEA